MNQIWLDVTTILNWQRPAVGIIRVEAECASYGLAQSIASIKFCCFDAIHGYQQVDPAAVRVALDRILGKKKILDVESVQPAAGLEKNKTAVPNVLTSAPTPTLSWDQKFKNQVLLLINKLPGKLRVSVFNFSISRVGAFDDLIRGCKEIGRAIVILFVAPRSDPKPLAIPIQQTHSVPDIAPVKFLLPFQNGDVYVSMGLDWDQKDLSYIYKEKRAVGFKVLLFCYDVIPVKLPHLCVGDVSSAFARYFANVAWCADEILCISECSRRDLRILLTELGAPVPSLTVVKLGCALPTITSTAIAPDVAEIGARRYILFVSSIERRKNHETLYRAYTRLVDQGETDLPLLVFVGMAGWGVNDLMADLRLDPRTKDLVRVLNHVTDSDLARLYQQAMFTVFPSIYEGWGLPVGESLAAGKFCLVSNVASLPEVGGNLVEYLDPWDVPAWAARIAWYIHHPEDLLQRERRIRLEYEASSWSDTGLFVTNRALRMLTDPNLVRT